MKELFKLAALMKNQPWPKLCYVISIFLLYEHIVTFSEALALILLPAVLDKLAHRAR